MGWYLFGDDGEIASGRAVDGADPLTGSHVVPRIAPFMYGRPVDGRRGYVSVAGNEERGDGSAGSGGGEQLTGKVGTFRVGWRVALDGRARGSAQDLGIIVEYVAAQDSVR